VSQERVDTVLRGYDLFNRGEFDQAVLDFSISETTSS
jgi:hypothetical protein